MTGGLWSESTPELRPITEAEREALMRLLYSGRSDAELDELRRTLWHGDWELDAAIRAGG